MSENNENSNKTGCGYVVLIIIVFTFWGLTSMVNGKGFFNGIAEQLFAGLILGGIVIAIIIIHNIFGKK